MTPLGLLLGNTPNFTYVVFSNFSKNFSTPSTFRLQSYNSFLFLTNFLINFIKIYSQ